MSDPSPFISSCSRRELGRRRAGRNLARQQALVVLVLLIAAVAAFVAGHGGI